MTKTWITERQIAERDRWESLLMSGSLSLADAVVLMLRTGAPATPYLIDRLEGAFQGYQYGGPDADLAEEFGVSISQRERKKEERRTWVSHVRFHVDAFHQQGFSKQDPSQFSDTAFHKAGNLLHRSASQIFDTYYKG
jgi:hypothetical protein